MGSNLLTFINFLVLASILCLCSTSPTLPANESSIDDHYGLLSSERSEEIFELWKEKHGKVYGHGEEAKKRSEIFKSNLRYIIEERSSSPSTYTMGLTQFADLSHEEFQKTYLSMMPINKTTGDLEKKKKSGARKLQSCAPPSSLDWRDRGIVTGVKNQGLCVGSSWAFSATGAIEGINALTTGQLISLSDQEIISCNIYNNECVGGNINSAFKWIIESGGIRTDNMYPWEGNSSLCRKSTPEEQTVSISSYVDLPQSETDILCALLRQPISVVLSGVGIDFALYTGGIHTGRYCDPGLPTHAVLLVGYGIENTKNYWILKNSWGTGWGEKGFFRLLRGGNACGISDLASYPTI